MVDKLWHSLKRNSPAALGISSSCDDRCPASADAAAAENDFSPVKSGDAVVITVLVLDVVVVVLWRPGIVAIEKPQTTKCQPPPPSLCLMPDAEMKNVI